MHHPIRNIPLRYNSPVQVDRQVSMRIVLARIEWLAGKADTAVGIVADCIARALSDHAFALCHTLALAACPIAFWRGDIAEVRRRAEQLVDHSARNAAPYWRSWGEIYLAAAEMYERRTAGDGETLALPFAASQKQRDMLATLNIGFLGDEALARADGGLAGWCAPEILRARAIALHSGREATARREAEGLLLRSLDAARGHDALAWELRTATSLAELRRDQKRFGEARNVLGPVYDRIREGSGTADLVAAKALLDALP
jgi:hypothetical protein